ncbi:MAG: ribonuclease PH [Alphaproteobacteria bacterium]|nr:ribonuclease PH [Alphaproteobacteria bacterium]
MRPSQRKPNELRKLKIEPNVSRYAEGSCLISCGGTRVLCTATVEDKPPPFLKNTGKGWVTAEYGMLPRSTESRMPREAAKGKQSGRTQEIQRLIGRSLRSVVDLKALGERQILIDCDVIEADGGTRTAAITGGYVALTLAIDTLIARGILKSSPVTNQLAAVSCGIYNGHAVLDLDYIEDSSATMDANFVLTADGKIVEIQCTAEDSPVTDKEFAALYKLAKKGIRQLASAQSKAIGK